MIVNDQPLNVQLHDGVFHLEGEFDTDDVPTFEQALQAAPTDTSCVVDLSGLTFGGSAAVAALLQVHHRFGKLVLRGTPHQFRRVLTITHAASLFEFED